MLIYITTVGFGTLLIDISLRVYQSICSGGGWQVETHVLHLCAIAIWPLPRFTQGPRMDDGQRGQEHLTWVNVGIGLLFLIAGAILSLTLKLGVEASLLTAAARCILQLSIMVRLTAFFIAVDVLMLHWNNA